MRIKVTKRYFDVQLGRTTTVGEELEVSDQRGTELVNNPNGIVEAIGVSKSVAEVKHDTQPPLKSEEGLRNDNPETKQDEPAQETEDTNTDKEEVKESQKEETKEVSKPVSKAQKPVKKTTARSYKRGSFKSKK